jgi:uncharacterized delta-60 repeat protein
MEVAVIGANGRLDATFGGDGTAAGDPADDQARWIAVQPDGKIVVAGGLGPAAEGGVLVRYNPDGTRDATFDADGKLVVHDVFLGSLAVRTDGRIFSAGQPFVEVTSDGAEVSVVGEPFGAVAGSWRAAAAPDGSVVVGMVYGRPEPGGEVFMFESFGPGSARGPEFIDVVRPRVHKVVIDANARHLRYRREFSVTRARLEDITVQPDGKVLAAGEVWSGAAPDTEHVAVLRLNPDLSPDQTFGKRGVFQLPARAASSFPSDLVPLADGKVVVPVHVVPNRGDSYAAVLRLTANGRPDRGFGRRGESRLLSEHVNIVDAAVQGDGKYVVYGSQPDTIIGAAARYVIEEARRK